MRRCGRPDKAPFVFETRGPGRWQRLHSTAPCLYVDRKTHHRGSRTESQMTTEEKSGAGALEPQLSADQQNWYQRNYFALTFWAALTGVLVLSTLAMLAPNVNFADAHHAASENAKFVIVLQAIFLHAITGFLGSMVATFSLAYDAANYRRFLENRAMGDLYFFAWLLTGVGIGAVLVKVLTKMVDPTYNAVAALDTLTQWTLAAGGFGVILLKGLLFGKKILDGLSKVFPTRKSALSNLQEDKTVEVAEVTKRSVTPKRRAAAKKVSTDPTAPAG